MPASALVLIGLTAMAANGTPMREVLGGYAEPSVWLVLVAMLIAKMMLDCGLARRIALLFVRAVGKTSLGVAYALQMTDVTLASGVPSITARSAGMVLPIGAQHRGVVRLASEYRSRRRLGAFLVAAMYQGSAVACAMFITGQASNLLGANLALKLVNVEVTGAKLVRGGDRSRPALVPGRAVDHLPGAASGGHLHARGADLRARELQKMGPLTRPRMDHPAGVCLGRHSLAHHGLSPARRHARRLRGHGGAAGHRHHDLADGRRRTVGMGCVHLVRRHAADGRAAQRHRLHAGPRRTSRLFAGIPWSSCSSPS